MSNEELENYKALYSQYLEEVIKYHNAYLRFLNHFGRESKIEAHRHNKNIIKLQKQLFWSCTRVHVEQRKNNRERLEAKRAAKLAERARRKANPLKRGPKKKTQNDLDISKSTSRSTT